MSKETATTTTQKTLVPEIRFEGFDGEWIPSSLGQVAEVTGGGTPSTTVPEYWNGTINWYSPLEIGDANYVNESQKKITEMGLAKCSAQILPVGTVLFTSRAGIGSTAILSKEGATNQGFQSIIPKEDFLDSYFIYSRTNELKRYGESKGAGSTFVEVSGKQMKKMPLNLPPKEEQQTIGNLFEIMDTNILSKQKELTKLQNFKQAMLQKLFPKEGEKEPEMRFEGFEGEWVECTINDIGMIITGNTPSTSEASNYTDKGIPWITPTDIKSNNNVRAAKTLSNAGAQKARVVPEGSILVTCIASIGKNTIVLEESGFNQQINAVIPNNDLDSYFLLALSVHWSNSMKKIAGAGTMDIVNRTEFSKIKTYIPHYTEQKQIGDYFYKLDKNIQSKQAELKKLKQFKQAMLSKLFV